MLNTTLNRIRRRAGLLLAVALVAASAAAFTRAAPVRFFEVENPGPLPTCRVPDAGVLYHPDVDQCAEADHEVHDVVTAVEIVIHPTIISSGDYGVFVPCPAGKWPISGGYESFGATEGGPVTVSGSRPEQVGDAFGWMVEGSVPYGLTEPTEGGEPTPVTLSTDVEVVVFCAYLGRGLILPPETA